MYKTRKNGRGSATRGWKNMKPGNNSNASKSAGPKCQFGFARLFNGLVKSSLKFE